MKSNTICQVILAGSIILASCQSNNSAKQDESQQTMNETVMNKVTDYKISAGNITFTNAINGAENCVKLLDDGALEFHCTEGLDFFSDPNGKLFEQDEYGNHRIVTVRTQGTSDDNNHDKLDVSSVYLKISSDTKTIASYYSIDKKRWNMVRLYKNCYPKNIYLGISSQCPQKGSCTSRFEEISLSHDNVSDFRLGE